MKTKALSELVKGETLLTNIRKVSGGKYQIEIREFIENPDAKPNVAAIFNKSDERFASNIAKTRAAWQAGEAKDISEALGFDVTELTYNTVDGRELAEVNMLNPMIAGERLHIRLVDSFEQSNEKQQPKQVVDKKTGEITHFMCDGKHIYQSTQIVIGTPVHSVIKSDERVKQVSKTKIEAMSLND
jgi:hypothetical protein